MKTFRASEFYSYYRPSKCELRVYLSRNGEPAAAPSPYQLILMQLGERHERAHLATLGEAVDLSGFPREEAETKTVEEVRRGTAVIYQPAFKARHVVGGAECLVVGSPDFLLRRGDGYVIRDAKLARRIGPRPPKAGSAEPTRRRSRPAAPEHPEILRQVEIYGWLYEQTFGVAPLALEVLTGISASVEVPYDGGAAALELLGTMLRVAGAPMEPYEAVGWSKCGCCGYRERCWRRAEGREDLSLIRGVEQNVAVALHRSGVDTTEQLLARFDEPSLTEFRWTTDAGRERQIRAQRARRILLSARVLASREEVLLHSPAIPEATHYAVFDIEGLPAQLDELEKIYLWGIQIFGESPGSFLPALAGFSDEGDREGWESFLRNAATILDFYGDIPFVHWGNYELTKIRMYVDRFGDRDGVAERVLRNLVDLCRITEDSIVLPLPSYSLKVLEKYVGFRRKLSEYDGNRAMASYIEAVETGSAERQEAVMAEILAYNQQDLEATWAVLQWLKSKRG